jgi:pyrroline-5-carboxylate reductase
MKLIFIGAGNMAEAIIEGTHKAYDVTVVARGEDRLKELDKKFDITTDLLDDKFDISGKNLILCVKPYALEDVSKKFIGKANSVISVLAGTTIESLKNSIQANYFVRVMPNLAASYGKSMTTLCGDETYKNEAMKICQSFGTALWLGSEKELDIATAVGGSGPALLALVAEAMSDGLVKEGMKRTDSDIVVKGLFEGFNPLLKNYHPALLKDAVMSPGGTTAAAYASLEEGRVRDSFIKAVGSAYRRAKGDS